MSAVISPAFLNHAAEILADTEKGLTGPQIVRVMSAYAAECNVDVPHAKYPFDAPNKRSALYENLCEFPSKDQYRIIKELLSDDALHAKNPDNLGKLRLTLITRYSHLDDPKLAEAVSEMLIEQTKHWLDAYPRCLGLYADAIQKHRVGSFQRNTLDDLRLALEMLLKDIFSNGKSLENQIPAVGAFIKSTGGSPEMCNMFVKLIDYYSKYQNTYVKHDDAVIEAEVDLLVELTSSFMKHLIRLQDSGSP